MRIDRITIIPDVCGGEPTIRGMRITASQVLEMLAGGMTPEDILRDFPYLEKADIDACLEYAARHAAHREISVGSEVSRRREPSATPLCLAAFMQRWVGPAEHLDSSI